MSQSSQATTANRHPPIADADWPDEITDLLGGFAGSLNVYRVMAHHPQLLRSWVPLRRHLVETSALGMERLEVVILRVAHRLSSSYEWNHHVDRARKVGLSDDRITAMRRACEAMRPEDATIAAAVDEMLDDARISEETGAALHDLVGAHGVFDLIATVGFYQTLGCIVNSFHTPLDEGIEAGAL